MHNAGTESVAVVVAEPVRPERPVCGARTRDGAKYPQCHRPAGWGTDHAGEGRCKLHGGMGQKWVKRGNRYESVLSNRLRQLIAEHQQDPDPLNIFPEIAALRALFQEFIERYDVQTEALLAWHASYQLQRRPLPEEKVQAFERVVDEWEIALREASEPTEKQSEDLVLARKFVQLLRGGTDEAKPRQVLDLTDAYRVLGEVGRMVERVEKIRNANGISRGDFIRIHSEMTRVVMTYVHDESTRKSIAEGWLAIRL